MKVPAVILIYPAALSSFCEDGSSAEVAMCCLAAQINCPSTSSTMKGLCDVVMVLVPGDVHITRKHMCKEWRGLVFVNFTSCPLLSDIMCPALFMQFCWFFSVFQYYVEKITTTKKEPALFIDTLVCSFYCFLLLVFCCCWLLWSTNQKQKEALSTHAESTSQGS